MDALTCWPPQPEAKNNFSHSVRWRDVIAIEARSSFDVYMMAKVQSPTAISVTWVPLLTKKNIKNDNKRNESHTAAAAEQSSKQQT